LFEYHDEPLAPSSKLPNKVDDKTLKQRFQQISQVVDEVLEEKNRQRRQQIQIGYIQEILPTSSDSSSDFSLIVRPYLHAPEIDEVDEISYDEIL
jgi:tRNA A37 methylthiotransferase MiaB